jgi:ubiquinol-cytochrome c reductase cytochrome c1 subunit
MLRKALVLAAAFGLISAAPALAANSQEELRDVHWSFEGPFGKFDIGQLQRGYKVYHDVCSACHSMNEMHYFDLGQPGGPFYKEGVKPTDNPYVKAIAADFKIADIDGDTGDKIDRPATPADRFKPAFANEAAARASNGGALPPDLSLIVLARDGGPQYVFSLLRGYVPPPAGLTVPPGKSYNPWMSGDLTSYWHGQGPVPKGGFIAMPLQLTDDRVTYDDGTKATADQEAMDVVAFLAWASDPHQVERKQIGFSVLVYLFLFGLITYASYRGIWRKVGH